MPVTHSWLKKKKKKKKKKKTAYDSFVTHNINVVGICIRSSNP